MLTDPLAISAVLFALIFAAVRVTKRFAWAEKLSAVLWILFLAAAASNLGLIPARADVYGQLAGVAVPVAVCLVLFQVRLRDVRDAGAPILLAAVLAVAGTVAGIVLAGFVLASELESVLGAEAWKLAGPYTGTYVGGSLNFFALWEGLEIGHPDLFAAANAVDNLTLFPLMAIWLLVPRLLGSRPSGDASGSPGNTQGEAAELSVAKDATLEPGAIAALCGLALAITAASGWVTEQWIRPVAPEVPSILVVTTLALACGQIRAVRQLQGCWQLGQLAFFVFFAAVGSLIDVHQAIALAPVLFVYVLIVIATHTTVLYGLGRIFGMDVGTLTMASAATKAGPPLVLALAEQRKDWQHLALPGVIVGLLGYAAGNYIGFGVAHAMSTLTAK